MKLKAIAHRIKDILFDPVDKLQDLQDERLGDAFKYFLVLLTFSAVLAALTAAIMQAGMLGVVQIISKSVSASSQMSLTKMIATSVAITFGMRFVVGLVFIVLSLWLHLWVYLLGGRRGLNQTVKTVLYGSTPYLALSWIPLLGGLLTPLLLLWNLALAALGLKKLQKLSTAKSVLSVFIAFVLPAIILLVLALFVLVTGLGVFSGFISRLAGY